MLTFSPCLNTLTLPCIKTAATDWALKNPQKTVKKTIQNK